MFGQQLINSFKQLQTPFYYYDTDLLHKTLFAIKEAASLFNYNIHYAVKANANIKLLKIIKSYDLGVDCVSGNEIERALNCGFHPGKIVFAGVGKTDSEIKYAIEKDIYSINCESVEEINVVNTIASELNKKARIALRINPNVDPRTHKNITTGLAENKFGLSFSDLELTLKNIETYENLIIDGIHFHIGSQICDMEVFGELCERVNFIQDYIEQKGIKINHINLGGGLGINYHTPENQIPDFQSYFRIFANNLELKQNQHIHFEPGRSIVGQCGILISKVLYVKETEKTKLAIIDAGFTELLRPALYHAQHKMINLSSAGNKEQYDVAGPICETSDYFGRSIFLPKTKRGDLIAILSAGAYGEVMESQYNLRSFATKYFSEEIRTPNNESAKIALPG